MHLSLASCVVASDDQVHTRVGEEAVILGLNTGIYYGLAEVGLRVWSLIATPQRVSVLVSTIVDEFDVTRERCEADVLTLLESLLERELIRDVTSAGDETPS
jgi:hypothetical protein